MISLPYRVVDRRQESTDTVTVKLKPAGDGIGAWTPGQFVVVTVPEVGELPLPLSGGAGEQVQLTVRDRDPVTHALAVAPAGAEVGVRGPCGQGWRIDHLAGRDLVLLAGGGGLAILRPLLSRVLAERDRYGKVALLLGAREPADLIFTHEYGRWRAAGAQLLVTVDRPQPGWRGSVGLVTSLLARARFAGPDTAAFLCGPEVMMRLAARELGRRGVPASRVQVSLQGAVRCGIGCCGACQVGHLLVCRDGPVVDWLEAQPALSTNENALPQSGPIIGVRRPV
jgi:anaerobic sulfite reductase subunit B